MVKSEQVNEISKALREAQHVMKNAKSDEESHHGSYSTLKAIRLAVQEPFYKVGLSYSQLLGADERGDYVETLLMHDSGQFLCSRIYLRLMKNDMQQLGSAITYARRYSLAAIAGIDQKDDDATSAVTELGSENSGDGKEYRIQLGTYKDKSGAVKQHWLNGLTLEEAHARNSPTPGVNQLRSQVNHYQQNTSFRNALINEFLKHAEPFLEAKKKLSETPAASQELEYEWDQVKTNIAK